MEENVQSTPHGKLMLGGNAFRVTGIYSSSSVQAHHVNAKRHCVVSWDQNRI